MIFAAVVLLCVADGGVRHALLVAALVNSQVTRILFQRLSETDYHAVTEDREHAIYEGFLFAVHLDVLLVQELDDRLTDCHSGFAHCVFPPSNALLISFLPRLFLFRSRRCSL